MEVAEDGAAVAGIDVVPDRRGVDADGGDEPLGVIVQSDLGVTIISLSTQKKRGFRLQSYAEVVVVVK